MRTVKWDSFCFLTNLLKENNNANGRRNGDRFLENYVCQ